MRRETRDARSAGRLVDMRRETRDARRMRRETGDARLMGLGSLVSGLVSERSRLVDDEKGGVR